MNRRIQQRSSSVLSDASPEAADETDSEVTELDSGEEEEKVNSRNESLRGVRLTAEPPSNEDYKREQIDALNLFLMRNTNAKYEGEKLLRDAQLDQNLIKWQHPSCLNSVPPHNLTVTHVNHTHDLLRAIGVDAGDVEKQNSEQWLQNHSIAAMHLTIKDLIELGKMSKPKADVETGKPRPHLEFDATDILQFEYRIHQAIQSFTSRIKWCLQGSRKLFGLVQGERVAVCIDCSDANTNFGRIGALQQAMLHLIDEQLSLKKALFVQSFGTTLDTLWPNIMDVNCRTLEEAKLFVMTRQPSGGCNLLNALRHLIKRKSLDSILLIIGSMPDQPSEILQDFVFQMAAGRDLHLHVVAFDCSNSITNNTYKKLAEATGGRYHCYSGSSDEYIYSSSDVKVLLDEIDIAQEVIKKITEMRHGMLDSTLVSIMNEISMEVDKLPQSRFLPRPPGHDEPLSIEEAKFQPSSSIDWLLENGLKANKMDLYQVLAPNAFSYKEEFIPIIRKTVQSQVHERAMAQFPWHDGSVKNIHVDLSQLFEYQKQLGYLVKIFEQRINWLASASRRIFGTIVEKNVVFILDMSMSNINYLIHIQHSMRLLLEQQMVNKDYFNIVAFGSEIKFFNKTLVKVTPKTLQTAWKWILQLECSGSRNFLSALRRILENDEEEKHGIMIEGLYHFTSGIPDQAAEYVSNYLEQKIVGRDVRLHCVLFNVDDYDKNGAISGRYANITKTADTLRFLAHCSGGRFHWFRETGIIESDDIRLIMTEIDKAVNFSRKAKLLVDTVKAKYESMHPEKFLPLDQLSLEDENEGSEEKAKPIGPPKPTAKSIARQAFVKEAMTSDPTPKALAYRSMSSVKSEPLESVKLSKTRLAQKSAFYTEDKNKKGAVYSQFQENKSVRKGIGKAEIPDKEDQVTSKMWFKRYSLSKLGLDLYRLVSGPDCKHEEKMVKPINKVVSAKYCSGLFPTVNIRGITKHLQYTPLELDQYDAECVKALKRYLKRLQWLMIGSRRIFGVISESRVIVLIDVSGSMELFMDELKAALKALIWEQLYKYRISFNLIAFSSDIKKWSPQIESAEEDVCHAAIAWCDRLVAHGNTATLDALEAAFAIPDKLESIYLLTDGKPDTSTSSILRSVNDMDNGRNISVNTISFNCCDTTANTFLLCLAQETGGRFHKVVEEFDAQVFAHRLLQETKLDDPEYPNLPEFEGDDLKRLAKEIDMARRYLCKSQYFKNLYFEMRTIRNENLNKRDNRIVAT